MNEDDLWNEAEILSGLLENQIISDKPEGKKVIQYAFVIDTRESSFYYTSDQDPPIKLYLISCLDIVSAIRDSNHFVSIYFLRSESPSRHKHVEFRKLEFKNEYTQAHAILSTLARELDVLKQHDLRDIALQFPAFCPLWHSVIGYPVIKTASLKIYEILSDVNRTFLQSKMVAESSQLYFLTNDDEPADKDAYFDILAIARQCCKQGIQLYCVYDVDDANSTFNNEKFWSGICTPSHDQICTNTINNSEITGMLRGTDMPTSTSEGIQPSQGSTIYIPRHDNFRLSSDDASEDDNHSGFVSELDDEEELEDAEDADALSGLGTFENTSGDEDDMDFNSIYENRTAVSRMTRLFLSSDIFLEVKLFSIVVDTRLPTRKAVYAEVNESQITDNHHDQASTTSLDRVESSTTFQQLPSLSTGSSQSLPRFQTLESEQGPTVEANRTKSQDIKANTSTSKVGYDEALKDFAAAKLMRIVDSSLLPYNLIWKPPKLVQPLYTNNRDRLLLHILLLYLHKSRKMAICTIMTERNRVTQGLLVTEILSKELSAPFWQSKSLYFLELSPSDSIREFFITRRTLDICPELVANFESLISLEIGNASPAKRHNIIFSDRRLENAHYRRFMDDLLAFAQPARFSSDHTSNKRPSNVVCSKEAIETWGRVSEISAKLPDDVHLKDILFSETIYDFTLDALRKFCTEMNVSKSGTKTQLIERLRKAMCVG